MRYTVERILRNDSAVVNQFQSAVQRWQEILSSDEARQVQSLAERLAREQNWFEEHCGGKYAGQEMMVVSGLARFYRNESGFEGNERAAKYIYSALRKSQCALEVKAMAREVATFYGLVPQSL